jgi:hypothetical protein
MAEANNKCYAELPAAVSPFAPPTDRIVDFEAERMERRRRDAELREQAEAVHYILPARIATWLILSQEFGWWTLAMDNPAHPQRGMFVEAKARAEEARMLLLQ